MSIAARSVLIVVCVRLLAWSSQTGPAPADWTVRLRGVGPLTIGMSLDEVRRVVGDPDATLVQALSETQQLPREPDDSPCAYLRTKNTPAGIGLMFGKKRLNRIDATKPGIRTVSGLQVGDIEARVLELYGARIQVTPHHYPPEGAHYMIFTPASAADRDYQMLFETDGAKVTNFRVGFRQAVGWVEGCA